MALGSAFITLASLVYFDESAVAPFVLEKLPVRFETLWRWSLRLHVASALVSFPACLLLMTRWVQRRRTLHRYLGRVTGMVVGCVLVPSGLVLSTEAKGGLWVSLGFVLSGLIVVYALVRGVRAARRGHLTAHAHAMRHVFAQMSVAVTSRALLVLLELGGVDPNLAYVVALWVPVVGSALAAEALSGRSPLAPLRLRPSSLALRSSP